MTERKIKPLPERLRNLCLCEPGCWGRCMECPQEVVNEAADTIERLERIVDSLLHPK